MSELNLIEAARETGFSRQYLRLLCKSGQIPFTHHKRAAHQKRVIYWLDETTVQQLKESKQQK